MSKELSLQLSETKGPDVAKLLQRRSLLILLTEGLILLTEGLRNIRRTQNSWKIQDLGEIRQIVCKVKQILRPNVPMVLHVQKPLSLGSPLLSQINFPFYVEFFLRAILCYFRVGLSYRNISS